MQVEFTTAKLAKLCSTSKLLRKEFGVEGEKLIRRRLYDLEAAPDASLMHALPGKFEELKADLQGRMSVRVHGGHRIIFRPTISPPPRKADGGLDLTAIEAVTIEAIRDYH